MADGLGTFGLGTQTLGRAIKEPMFKLNNSGFNPTSGPYGFTPTVGVSGSAVTTSKSLAKPQVVPAVVQPAVRKSPTVKPGVSTSKTASSKGVSKAAGTASNTPTLAGSAPDYDALDSAQAVQDMKLGYTAPSAVVPQVANTTAVIPSLANPAMADLYTGSDFSKLSPDQQAAFASSGGTIGDTGNMIPGQGGTPSNWDIGDIAKGVEAGAGLANAYLGFKNYGLAKDQFGFTKALANRNIANQASEYNTGLQNAGEVGMSLAGNTMDPAARAARQAQLTSQKISGAPIG